MSMMRGRRAHSTLMCLVDRRRTEENPKATHESTRNRACLTSERPLLLVPGCGSCYHCSAFHVVIQHLRIGAIEGVQVTINEAEALRHQIKSDIETIVQNRANHWLALQDLVASFLKSYKHEQCCRGAIYLIYTRRDKQEHLPTFKHLKETPKIIDEIVTQRLGLPKRRGGVVQNIKKNSSFWIYDIHDIIGITVVCPLSSDIQRVATRLDEEQKSGRLIVLEKKSHDGSETGYVAEHRVVASEQPNFENLTCEIQIKVAIQDAFAQRSHDLTYKPIDQLDSWFVQQMKHINDVMMIADRQSESIFQRVHEIWNEQEQSKKAAREILLFTMRHNLRHLDEGDYRNSLEDLQNRIEEVAKDEEGLDRDRLLVELRKSVEQLENDNGRLDNHLCRLAALIAFLMTGERGEQWANDCFVRWRQSARDSDEMALAYQQHAHMKFCYGETDDAIDLSERGLDQFADSNIARDRLISYLFSLAYYYADIVETRDGDLLNAGQMADKYMIQASGLAGDFESLDLSKAHYLDTIGYVEIVLAKSEQDIVSGLEKCKRVWEFFQNSPDVILALREASDRFYALHKKLAYLRLADFAATSASS